MSQTASPKQRYNLTDRQRSNLAKLAVYLRDLPPVPPVKFYMRNFATRADMWECTPSELRRSNQRQLCGTTCCALGHGPLAGIKPELGQDWERYGEEQFGVTGRMVFSYLFNGDWDNNPECATADDAARRIANFLVHGLPANWSADTNTIQSWPVTYVSPDAWAIVEELRD